MILIQLNQFGQYCGIEKHFNEKNDIIKIKNSQDLEWVKMNKFYFILMKDNAPTKYLSSADFKFLINCEHVGEKLAIDCKQYPMTSIDEFPCHEESTKNVKPTNNLHKLSPKLCQAITIWPAQFIVSDICLS